MHGTVNVNIQLDAEVKEAMEKVCDDLGVSMETAFQTLAKRVAKGEIEKEDCVPDREDDPFYAESNMRYLEKKIRDCLEGRAHFTPHDLIEVEDDD